MFLPHPHITLALALLVNPEVPDLIGVEDILAADLGDQWEDARISEVVEYLYGCKGLQLSPEWRPLFKP